MARLSKVQPENSAQETRRIFDAYLKERGKVPNMALTVAHRPEIMTTMNDHFWTVMKTGTVDHKLKEMVAVRVSHLNGCDY